MLTSSHCPTVDAKSRSIKSSQANGGNAQWPVIAKTGCHFSRPGTERAARLSTPMTMDMDYAEPISAPESRRLVPTARAWLGSGITQPERPELPSACRRICSADQLRRRSFREEGRCLAENTARHRAENTLHVRPREGPPREADPSTHL